MSDLIMSKCCNASYCKYSNDKTHCNADDDIQENCPYLNAIAEIARLYTEEMLMYDDEK